MKATILLLSVFLSLSSCSKDSAPQDQLPTVTTIGANTAGCIINSKVIIPKNSVDSFSGYPVYGLNYSVSPNFGNPLFNEYFSIRIANIIDKGHSYWIYIHINDMTNGIGNYTINQSNSEFYLDGPNNPEVIVRETLNGISGKTFISANNAGIIKITRFDYPNKIISGLFNCVLYNRDNPNETIDVNQGRFDINLGTLNQ